MAEDIVARLNELLEAERAGVEALSWIRQQELKEQRWKALEKMAQDESWSCRGLGLAIRRHGGTLSAKTGDFAQKLMALGDPRARWELLAKGQAWVVKRLDILLSLEQEGDTRQFLLEMRQRHQANIQWCQEVLAEAGNP